MENPVGSMAEIRRANHDAFAFHSRFFSHQFEVYKRIAGDDWRSAPSATKKTRNRLSAKFAELENILENEMENFSKVTFSKSDANVSRRVVSLTIFMHLNDVLKELHHATLKENRVGLYHLFDTVSDQLFALMLADYFERPYRAVIQSYLLIEPGLMACADLAGVELVTIQSAVRINQPKLSKKLETFVSKRKGQEAKNSSKKSAKNRQVAKKHKEKKNKRKRK